MSGIFVPIFKKGKVKGYDESNVITADGWKNGRGNQGDTRESNSSIAGERVRDCEHPFTDEWYSKESMEERGVVQIPLCFLAKSLESMSLCHAVYFCKGWENTRGCRIEHDAAVAYGLDVIYEK